MLGEVVCTSVLSVRLCLLIAAREDSTTALISMSLQAFEHSLRIVLREVLSQYPFASAVVRPGPGRPPVCRPSSVFCVSVSRSNSECSGRELSSVLELEPTVGELSSVPEPEGADGVGPGWVQ